MIEFLFKYPSAVFADSQFTMASNWPLWLIPATAALFLAGMVYLLRHHHPSWGAFRLSSIALLQLSMILLMLFVLWQPALLTERLVQGENSVAVLLDTSSSMSRTDDGETRMSRALSMLDEDSLAELKEQYNVKLFSFDDTATEMDSIDLLPAPGEHTQLGQSILQALDQSSSSSLGALIMISDGADNDGAISQQEMNDIIGYGIPIHTVGMGREVMSEDIELSNVSLPRKALPGSTVTARLDIRHDQGGVARVKVYDGEDFILSSEIPLDPDQTSTVGFIDLELDEPGQMDLRFSIDPGNDERIVANNTRHHVLDVTEGSYRILYVEGEPRWEYKFMQRALGEDPSVQLSTLLRVTPNKYYRQGIDSPEQLAEGFPVEKSELFQYDALIIGSVEVAEFTEEQQEMIRDFVSERGGSLMMIAGLNGLGLGGWGESVVNTVLPSRLNAEEAAFTRLKAPVSLSDAGASHPMLRFSDDRDENLALWAELPEIADYQQIGSLRPAASTLLTINVDGADQPLLVTQPYGKGRSFIFATGGTWRWQMSMPLEDMKHETFWRQLARALVADSPRPFELSSRIENNEIKISAQIRDPDAEQNRGLQLTAAATSDSGEIISLDMQAVAGQPGMFEAEFSPAVEGLYAIEAISRIGDTPVNSVRTAVRYQQNQENFSIRQNRPLLERLSTVTNGSYWTPEQWDDIPEAIAYSTAGITEQNIRYLWDAPFFFFLLILLKISEWLLRRRWSAI